MFIDFELITGQIITIYKPNVTVVYELEGQVYVRMTGSSSYPVIGTKLEVLTRLQ